MYARNDSEVKVIMKTVKRFSDDVGMALGWDKCAKATILWALLKQPSFITLGSGVRILCVDQKEAHGYIGVNDSEEIYHKFKEKRIKEIVRKVDYRGVWLNWIIVKEYFH